MNYLAHIHLARESEDAMLGGFLGDFLRPEEAGVLGPTVVREIMVHRHVDAFTDAHPQVREARRLCQPPHRLFARISLDVYYDHVLATHWERYTEESLDSLVARFYSAIVRVRLQLPAELRGLVERMVRQDWLRSYVEPGSVDAAVARLAQRLSRKGDHLIASLHDLRAHPQPIEAGFHAFYPELETAARWRRQQLLQVW